MKTAILVSALLTTALATPAMARGHHHHRHPFHHHHRHLSSNQKDHDGAPSGEDQTSQSSDSAESGSFANMVPSFVAKLREAFSALPVGSCHVGSGYRTHAEQAALRRSKGSLAARPGHSNHERGLAADLSCDGGALAWLHHNAEKFGLRFPMSYEAWHIEPEGATRVASARHHPARYAYLAGRHRRVHYAHHHRYRYAQG